MQRSDFLPVRLLLEILVAVGLAGAAVMFILPALAPGLSEVAGAVADAFLLTVMAWTR